MPTINKIANKGISLAENTAKYVKAVGKRSILETSKPTILEGAKADLGYHTAGKALSQSNPKIAFFQMDLFRRYDLVKNFDMTLTPKELDELFKYEGDEFFLKSYEFLCGKLGLTEATRPGLMLAELHPDYAMLYAPASHTIYKNSLSPSNSPKETLLFLRHEFQHCMQNLSIFRHEELGEEAVKVYTELITKDMVADISQRAQSFSLDQIRAMGFPEEGMRIYEVLTKLFSMNRMAEYEQCLQHIATDLNSINSANIEQLRQSVVKEFGIIKKDSKAGSRAEKFFKEFLDAAGYKHVDGAIHFGKYLLRAIENEAFIAQDALRWILEGKPDGCYIKNMKNFASKFKPEERVIKDVNEVSDVFDNPKAIIKYLYD